MVLWLPWPLVLWVNRIVVKGGKGIPWARISAIGGLQAVGRCEEAA